MLSFALRTFAQSTRPAPASGDQKNETITLPEFSVSTSRTNDYVAAESITGTRIASKILELPFNVNVATREFIDDFNLTELNDQIAFMSSVAPSEGRSLPGSGQGSVPIRGFTADADLRNGFRRLGGAVAPVSIDRVEVIKGPAAGIYGRIQPGGVVNIVTKRPAAQPDQRLLLAVGNYDQLRGEVSSTGAVGGRSDFLYRVDLTESSREFKMKYRDLRVTAGDIQLMWKPTVNRSLLVEIEQSRRHEVPGMFIPVIVERGLPDPYQINTNGTAAPTINFFKGPAMNLLHFNSAGPGVWTDVDMSTITLTYDQRFTPVWSLRGGLNLFEQIEDRQFLSGVPTLQQASSNNAPDFTQIFNGSRFGPTNTARYPDYDRQRDNGYNFQVDLVGAFATGAVNHKLLLTFDASRAARRRREYQMFITAANDVANNGFNQPLAVANPNYSFKNFRQAPELYGTRVNNNYYNADKNSGIFLSERASLFHNRLIVLVGGRYDYVQSLRNQKLVAPGDLDAGTGGNPATFSEFNNDGLTYQAGVNFALTPGTMLYASRSTSYQPQSRTRNDGTILPNESGEGTEAGVKLSWLDNRLNLTAGYYDIVRKNLARQVLIDIDRNLRDWFSTGEEGSKGTELDVNWQLLAGFQVFGGWGHNQTKTLRNDQQRYLVGTTPRRVPTDNAGGGFRYEVQSGALKGVFLTGGIRYYGSSIALDPATRTLSPSTRVIINGRLPNGELIYSQFAEGAYIYRDAITVSGKQTIKVDPNATVTIDDGRSQVVNPGYALLQASIGYRWRGALFGQNGVAQRVQLNIQNLADKQYATVALKPGDPQSWLLTYTVNL